MLEHFEGEAFRDPAARALMRRIHAAPFPETEPGGGAPLGAEIRVTLDDGRTLAKRVERALGRGSDNPLPDGALHAKFANCAGRALPPSRVERLLQALARLDQADSLRDVVAAMTPSPTADQSPLTRAGHGMPIRTAMLAVCGVLAVLGADRRPRPDPDTACTDRAALRRLYDGAASAAGAAHRRLARQAVRGDQGAGQKRAAPRAVSRQLADRALPARRARYLARAHADRDVLNAGVSGDRSENLLWRLQNGNLAGKPPSLVVMLIGTNDLAYDGKPRSPALAAEGIRANLLYLRQALPDTPILLLGLLPRGASPEFRAAPQDGRRQRADFALRRSPLRLL